eukprot:SAG31_NODE_39456_length_288_cov_0.746032_1_plen_65_part_10
MQLCAAALVEGDGRTAAAFFKDNFQKRWIHMSDANGHRAAHCTKLFTYSLLRPVLGEANTAFLRH